MKELSGLTGLRFLAALYVFFFHAQRLLGFAFLPAPLRNIVSQGALGVTLFFVLSGFILTYVHAADFAGPGLPAKGYYGQFLWRRLARIYPVHLVCLLACLGLSWAFASYPAHFLAIVALDVAMLESYVPWVAMQWYGGGAWSISTEFFFYLLFPLLLPLFGRVASQARLLGLLAALVVASSLPGFYYTFHQASLFELAYNFPPSRLPEFCCGMVLGLLVLRHGLRVPEGVALGLLGLALVYLATFAPRLAGYTVHHVVVVPALLALLVVLAHAEDQRLLRWVGSAPMRYLGRISFSFYLAQLVLTELANLLIESKMIPKSDGWLLPLFVATLGLAVGLYELVEKKARYALLRRLPANQVPLPQG